MKKILFSVVTLLSLVPCAPLQAFGDPESVTLPAMDPRVLKLFAETKDQIAVKQIDLLQKNRDQMARIKELESTINEESFRKGRNNGLAIAGTIGAVAVALTFFLASQSTGRSTGSSSWSR